MRARCPYMWRASDSGSEGEMLSGSCHCGRSEAIPATRACDASGARMLRSPAERDRSAQERRAVAVDQISVESRHGQIQDRSADEAGDPPARLDVRAIRPPVILARADDAHASLVKPLGRGGNA